MSNDLSDLLSEFDVGNIEFVDISEPAVGPELIAQVQANGEFVAYDDRWFYQDSLATEAGSEAGMTSHQLRDIADELDRRNTLVDQYEAACDEQSAALALARESFVKGREAFERAEALSQELNALLPDEEAA